MTPSDFFSIRPLLCNHLFNAASIGLNSNDAKPEPIVEASPQCSHIVARNSRFVERPYTDFPVVGVLTGLQGAIPTQQPIQELPRANAMSAAGTPSMVGYLVYHVYLQESCNTESLK